MNWYIIELPKIKNSEKIINDLLHKKIRELEIIIENIKVSLTPH